jgi:hypothetical protein
MLYLVKGQGVQRRYELVDRARQTFDFRDNPWVKLLGMDRQFANDAVIERSVSELFSRGWVVDQEPLILSDAGKEYLRQQNKHRRRRGHSNGDISVKRVAA